MEPLFLLEHSAYFYHKMSGFPFFMDICNMSISEVKPYSGQTGSKKEQVTSMFNRISGTYDLLNRILSLGIDRSWRKILVKDLSATHPLLVLDVATGTADLAIAIAKANPEVKVTGLDIAEDMLAIGDLKIHQKGLEKRVSLIPGDAEHLPFDNHAFDACTVAFGVRNFENLDAGLQEMHRVIKPGGKIWVLEFAQPTGWFRPFFLLYFKYLLPLIGRLTSKDAKAYRYLFDSVQAFPEGEAFCNILRNNGFTKVHWQKLTFGTCAIYTGIR